MTAYGNIVRDGLWHDNPGLAQLLGLCPLLAVSTSVVNGLALGLATLFVVCATNAIVSATRHLIGRQVRLPVFVLIIASLVTVTGLIVEAFFYEIHRGLGLFLPLITTNCLILARAEAFASRQPLLPSVTDGLAHGLGFTLVLVLLGAVRELTGHGTLLRDAEQLFGTLIPADPLRLPGEGGLLLMLMPAGAFIALGLIVAARNALSGRARNAIDSRAMTAE